jgi:predicted ATPase
MPMVHDFLQQVTSKNEKDTTDFANVLYQKSKGNPYFIKQYMGLLYSRGALAKNEETGEWDLLI